MPILSFAHEGLDWRDDYEAYLSVNYPTPYRTNLKASPDLKILDMSFFKEKLSVLTGVVPFKFEGKEIEISERKSARGLYYARMFLKEEYEKLGYTVSFHEFGNGTNVIAEKLGKLHPEKFLIISSHLDSVGNRGANDNGTGTIGALTIAKELAQSNPNVTLRFIAFDKEEIAITGSVAYVAQLRDRQNIMGNINIEMIGHNSKQDGAFHLIDCGRRDSLFLSEAIKSSITENSLPLTIVPTCQTKSDHGSFWRKGIPAVVISENFFGGDPDPCYHARCDVMDERLNYAYMETILTAVLKGIQKLAF